MVILSVLRVSKREQQALQDKRILHSSHSNRTVTTLALDPSNETFKLLSTKNLHKLQEKEKVLLEPRDTLGAQRISVYAANQSMGSIPAGFSDIIHHQKYIPDIIRHLQNINTRVTTIRIRLPPLVEGIRCMPRSLWPGEGTCAGLAGIQASRCHQKEAAPDIINEELLDADKIKSLRREREKMNSHQILIRKQRDRAMTKLVLKAAGGDERFLMKDINCEYEYQQLVKMRARAEQERRQDAATKIQRWYKTKRSNGLFKIRGIYVE